MRPSDMLPENAAPAKIRLCGKLDEYKYFHYVGQGVYCENDGIGDDSWQLMMETGQNWIGADCGDGIDAYVLASAGDESLCAVVIEDGYDVLTDANARPREYEHCSCEFLVAFLIDSRFVETKEA